MRLRSLLLIALLSVGVLSASAGMRKVYVTRHGQVGDNFYRFEPTKESKLTPLGIRQASKLGEYLKSKGFHGRIYASPFYRTLQTAQFAAYALNMKFYPEPGMQEFAPTDDDAPKPVRIVKQGMTPEQANQQFPGLLLKNPRFVYPWRVADENSDARTKRVQKMLKAIFAEYDGDILLVGHGAIVYTTRCIFYNQMNVSTRHVSENWNACLFVFEVDDNGVAHSHSEEVFHYLLPEEITRNFGVPYVPHPDDPRYALPKDKNK